jgi:transposase
VQLLPELLVLPADMTVRQWVAHAGLDPRACQSGSSVDKPARISKVGNAHIRRALFMPALVAVQHEPHVKAFFDRLVARGKKPIQAYVAVMRKLLHAIYGMFTTKTTFVGEKFRAAA